MTAERTTWDIRPMTKLSIGFDEIFNEILKTANSQQDVGYPPYNIVKFSDDNYAIELAIAGFEIHEIDVNTENNRLIVSGEKDTPDDQTVIQSTYIHKGISGRNFVRTFTLGGHIVVNGATIKNGMLTVGLTRILPDNLKPRKISITPSE